MTAETSAWEKAKSKIREGKEWRGTVTVPFGDETIDLTHRLLTEDELSEVRTALDLTELTSSEAREQVDEELQERVLELQGKDELTDDEQQELRELSRELQNTVGGDDGLDADAYDALMAVGKEALVPSEADIDAAMDTSLEEQQARFDGNVPQAASRSDFFNLIKQEMREWVDDQPYPIKTLVGQKAFVESLRLLGNQTNDSSANEES